VDCLEGKTGELKLQFWRLDQRYVVLKYSDPWNIPEDKVVYIEILKFVKTFFWKKGFFWFQWVFFESLWENFLQVFHSWI